MKFIPLNIRSIYSFLASSLKVEDIIKNATKNDYLGVGICDNALFGICEFVSKNNKENIPNIVGSTLLIDDLYVSLFIKDDIGYTNLIHLVSKSSHEKLTLADLKGHYQGLLIVVPVIQKAINPFEDDAIESLRKIIIPVAMLDTDFYLGIDANDPRYEKYVQNVRGFAQKFNYSCVAFPLIEYSKKEDAITIEILRAIEKQEKLTIRKLNGFNYFRTNEEYLESYTTNEIMNQQKIMESCPFVLFKKRGQILNYGERINEDSRALLRRLTIDGLKDVNKDKDQIYLDRVNYELKVIEEMGYEDYFLIVQDIVAFARKSDVPVGPGRGSAPGSLVSYALKITEVDPIKYNLLFERFLNPERQSLPDIDIDIEDVRRDVILEYIKNKYGKELVSHVITYQSIGAKQALRDVGRVFSYPERDISRMSKLVEGYNNTLRNSYRTSSAFRELVDSDVYYLEIVTLASKIEGAIRQRGQHAAGIILNDRPLEEVMPVVYDEDYVTSQFDKDYLEDLNFLKIDLLGLRNLQTIDYALKLINQNEDTGLTMYNIPYEDENIFKTIREDRVMGVFQLESAGMRNAIREVKPDCFEDIVAILALFRPGPMKNIPTFARRKHHQEPMPKMIEPLAKILNSTYGIVVYQEQIMELVRNMAGFTYGQADTFRKAISKKNKESMEQLRNTFMTGAQNNGYSFSDANSVFATIEKFASYGFNRSHSVAYAMIAARMAYLKHYYPGEFFASLLQTVGLVNEDRTQDYIKEMAYYGVLINTPTINASSNRYITKDNQVIMPLNIIKNIRNDLVNQIINIRDRFGQFSDIHDVFRKLSSIKIDKQIYLTLINAGVLDEFGYNRATIRLNLDRLINYGEMFKNLDDPTVGLGMDYRQAITECDDDIPLNLKLETEAIGIEISNNVLASNRQLIASYKPDNLASLIKNKDTSKAIIIGHVDRYRQNRNRDGSTMIFMDFTTLEATISVNVFGEVYQQSQELIRKNALLMLEGRLNYYKGRLTFVADKIKKIGE